MGLHICWWSLLVQWSTNLCFPRCALSSTPLLSPKKKKVEEKKEVSCSANRKITDDCFSTGRVVFYSWVVVTGCDRFPLPSSRKNTHGRFGTQRTEADEAFLVEAVCRSKGLVAYFSNKVIYSAYLFYS